MTVDARVSDTHRVSVLMTIYNAASFLRESIDSLLAQSFSDWELVAVENGSTDGSASILAGYADPRLRVFPFEKNIGRTQALRYAFEQAQGEYIAILDADDVSHPNRIARQVEFMIQNAEVAVLGSWAIQINGRGEKIGVLRPPTGQRELRELLGWANPIVHSSAMYRRDRVRQVGGYPSQLTYAQDYGLLLELAQRHPVAVLSEFLCSNRVLPTQMSKSRKYQRAIAEEQIHLAQYALATLSLGEQSKRLNRRSLALAEIRRGMASFFDGRYLIGLMEVFIVVARNPSVLWGNGPVRRFFGAKI
ncbi:MAG: O-antigen biosynthesis glycosyltransferase WbnJ [Nitrosomonadaceae bacterium]|nr:O-antigen biosynthesis glycosyltransferase WbnJ [Nitrosomonadaceae bacterium]